MLIQIQFILSHFKTVFGLHKNNNTLVPSLFLYINVVMNIVRHKLTWLDISPRSSVWAPWLPLTLGKSKAIATWPWKSTLRLTLTLSMSNTTAFDLRNDHYNYCLWLWTWSSWLPFDLGHPHYDCLWLWKAEL